MLSIKKSVSKRYCCVKGCNSNSTTRLVSLFRIPKDPVRCSLWLKNCDRMDLSIFCSDHLFGNYRVCGIHFEDKMFAGLSRSKLKKYAVPKQIIKDEPGPFIDMSDTNLHHVTVPSKYTGNTNSVTGFTTLSQIPGQPCEDSNSQTCNEIVTDPLEQSAVEEEEEEEYHCRTCLSVTAKPSSTSMTETLILDKTVKDVIIFLVPELVSKLCDDEVVCDSCLDILKSTMKFIVKCLEVDELLTKEKEDMQGVEVSQTFVAERENAKDAEDVEITEVKVEVEEHDYCGKVVSVGDIISTEDLDDISENVTLLEQVVDGADEGNSAAVPYENLNFENDVEIHYKGEEEEWFPTNEDDLSEEAITFQAYENYDENAILDELDDPLSCSTCMESFMTKEDLDNHMKKHPPHVCETCGKTYLKRESLRAHKVTHKDQNSYICEVCGTGFKDYRTLRCHVKDHTNVGIHVKDANDQVYNTQCTICGILSKNEASLKTHMKLVHFKEKPFECDICSKKFGRSDYLHNHKLRHMAQLQNVKPQPEKRKVRVRTKMRYKIQDKGEPVPCKFCGQWYKDIVRLKRHLETHLKRFPCRFCPLTFSRQVLCKKHEEFHRGGTVNFSRCNVCWKKFKTKEALDEHVKCHNNPQHFCDLCGNTFNRKFLLSQHKLLEHSNIPDKEQPEEIIYDSLLEVGGLSAKLDG